MSPVSSFPLNDTFVRKAFERRAAEKRRTAELFLKILRAIMRHLRVSAVRISSADISPMARDPHDDAILAKEQVASVAV
jgi:hypothetical protein